MRLTKARVQKYRSIRDTGWFDIEDAKTILVGPNEAGKTAVLKALQQINPPAGIPKFDPLRDYPRSEYNDITTKKVLPENVKIVEARFTLDEDDVSLLSSGFKGVTYVFTRLLNNSAQHYLEGGPEVPVFSSLSKDLARLCAHLDMRIPVAPEGSAVLMKPSEEFAALTATWAPTTRIEGETSKALKAWLDKVYPLIDEQNETEEGRFDKLSDLSKVAELRASALDLLFKRLPIFVLFNNYFRVKPVVHLDHLATRIETKVLDDDEYDYGNVCLLKLLGFTARALSDLGKTPEPPAGDPVALKKYRDQSDTRRFQLNAASVKLTEEIRKVWLPNLKRAEADRLKVQADAQYLKVVVEDDLGVEIELDQRSEGFQWLVSFFVVFFAETEDSHANAILLLDEPGMSLHGLKQRDFRSTLSTLGMSNQTIFTTHSPFLVGPDELDIVRVVEMTDRTTGTKVHTTVTASDPAGLLPLQEALGYDLAQSLFAQKRNLVLEGLTDYWYLEACALLLRESNDANLNEHIAMVPAANAGKVVYYATILHAQALKVAALLDSDLAGDKAANQETLIHTLGSKNILRVKDAYTGPVPNPEIEDLLRDTLIEVAKIDLSWDVGTTASTQTTRPIIDIFSAEISGFSKYKLAKAFLRWTRAHNASDLTTNERTQCVKLIGLINKALN